MKTWKEFINVRQGEWAPLLVFTLALMVNMISLEGTYVVSTSGFLSLIGARQIPLLLLVDMVIILITASLFSLIVDRWERKRLLQWIIALLIAFYVGVRLLFAINAPNWLTYPLLYLMAEQQLVLFPIAFWALANDAYSMAEAKRLFPLIAASGVIGSILGNGLAVVSTPILTRAGLASYELLVVNAVLLLLSYIVFRLATRRLETTSRQSTTEATVRETLQEGWDFVRNVDSFRFLALAMLGVGFVLTVIEYHFLATAGRTFETAIEFQAFYGLFRIGQTLITLVVQGVIANRLINKVGLKNAFLGLPASCLATIALCLATLTTSLAFIGVAAARLVNRVFLYGLDEPTRKSFQGLIPDERRGRVSAFLDGYLYSSGTIVACLLLIALLAFEGIVPISEATITWIYLGLSLLAAAAAFWSTWRMRSVYDASMLNWRLARRRRRSVSIDLDF